MPRFTPLASAVAAAVTLTLAASVPVLAQMGGFRNMDPAKRMDTNRDGRVTRDEFNQSNLQRANFIFDFMDKNRDGSVTFDEYREFQEKFSERRFQRLDTNRDGVLDSHELEAMKSMMPGANGDDTADAPTGTEDHPWMGQQPPAPPPAPPQSNGRY